MLRVWKKLQNQSPRVGAHPDVAVGPGGHRSGGWPGDAPICSVWGLPSHDRA